MNQNSNHKQQNTARNIIWFNLPCSQNVETNSRKTFFKLIKKNFQKDHTEYKVLSIRNVDRLSNSRSKGSCPLDDKCLQTCTIYKADLITNKDSHITYGASDGKFKFGYNNHTNYFCHWHHEQDIELSKHVWQLKDKGVSQFVPRNTDIDQEGVLFV